MESRTRNRKTREQVACMVERALNGLTLAQGDGAVSELKEGLFNMAYNACLADEREAGLKIAPPQIDEQIGAIIYQNNRLSHYDNDHMAKWAKALVLPPLQWLQEH